MHWGDEAANKDDTKKTQETSVVKLQVCDCTNKTGTGCQVFSSFLIKTAVR